MNKTSTLTSIVYGSFLVFGGIMGFIGAHSKISLIAGILSGLLVLLSCKVGATNSKAGYLFIASISLVLAEFFLMRFTSSFQFMPAGLMLLLSTITYVVVAMDWLRDKSY